MYEKGHLPLKIATESLKLFRVWTELPNTNKKLGVRRRKGVSEV